MRINDYFSKVILINLDRREDRLEKLSTQLNNLGITFTRFSAIDGKTEGINPIVAGTMSHTKVWEENLGKKIFGNRFVMEKRSTAHAATDFLTSTDSK